MEGQPRAENFGKVRHLDGSNVSGETLAGSSFRRREDVCQHFVQKACVFETRETQSRPTMMNKPDQLALFLFSLFFLSNKQSQMSPCSTSNFPPPPMKQRCWLIECAPKTVLRRRTSKPHKSSFGAHSISTILLLTALSSCKHRRLSANVVIFGSKLPTECDVSMRSN